MSYKDAYAFAKGKRSIVWPNSGFAEQLQLFEKLLKENTMDYLVTVIITDGEFRDMSKPAIVKHLNELKDYDGIIYFICNQKHQVIEEVSKQFPNKLHYILTTEQFELT